MNSYNKINNVGGWLAFAIALVVYLLSMSPTASFWDCGEFIACANELEVPHPPGAPFFLLIGRVFASLSFGDSTMVAWWLNILSVLTSAFTVMFTFWITTFFSRKMLTWTADQRSELAETKEPQGAALIAIMGAGMVAALANTFADSFWFNAVEAEVYAMSSFFTAIVVWLMCKWDARADQAGSDRWIVLIAYLMGCSIGVHLLNLLTIPALAFMYYFRKYNFSWGGFIATGGISVAILGLIQTGIIIWTFDAASAFEFGMVGTMLPSGGATTGLGLPVGTGIIVFLTLLVAALAFTIWYSERTKNLRLNTFIMSVVAIYIGFSSYAMIPIRSNANSPIDENNPENSISFLSYMKREQYGDRPLLYGPNYNKRPIKYDYSPEYILEDGKDRYTKIGKKGKPVYRSKDKVFFPRMYEAGRYTMGPHAYANYVKNKGRDLKDPYDDQPTSSENMSYFINYQVGHMYWRYFMWNFAGRENDFQDCGWESGLNFSNEQPDPIKNNRGKNHYFMLPFFLGLLGLGWQAYKRPWDASVVGMLFFFTGLAIVLYLNQYPMQPRERDYSFAGSFQTFAIWIGLGVIALYQLLHKFLKDNGAYLAVAIGLIPPIIMGVENWDDHSRANRYVAPDSAYNLLMSLEKNAVLFTNGDNDTFPLWYIQEVEGVRTDVRVLCLSYVNTDWYIDQMYHKVNESPALPLTLKKTQYTGQENQIRRVKNKRIALKLPTAKDKLASTGILTQAEAARTPDYFEWAIGARGGKDNYYLQLQDVLIVNLLENVAKQDWERPVYFANTVSPGSIIGLKNNLRLEGLAYRVLPTRYERSKDPYNPYEGGVDAGRMYKHLMTDFRYRGLDNPDVYFDENIARMITNYHGVFYRLADHYLSEADKKAAAVNDTSAIQAIEGTAQMTAQELRARAQEVMDYLDEKFPYKATNPEPYVIVRDGIMFNRLGDKEKSESYINDAYTLVTETLDYYADPDNSGKYFSKQDTYIAALQMLANHYVGINARDKAQDVAQRIDRYRKVLR
ncbi:MAG: DUF2723 domain-containing protein [Bacteroidia bacterium]